MSVSQSPSPLVEKSEPDIPAEATAPNPTSKNFNSEDAELTYESCDGVRFRIHAIYLETHCGVLSPPPRALLEDVVKLPEESGTLEHMFHFIYPRSQINLLTQLEPDQLWKLAEASEKYQVYPLMYACHVHMKLMLPQFAPNILAHALKHDYKELADQAAPSALDTKPQDMLDILLPSFHKVWLTYYDFWLGLQRRLLSTCENYSLVSPLLSSLSGLDELDSTLKDLSYTQNWLNPYRTEITQNRRITRLVERIQVDSDDSLSRLISTKQSFDEPREIRLTSNDGASFWMRRDFLLASAPGLVLPRNPEEKPVEVNTTSQTLALLLLFLQPRPIPDIGGLPFNVLEDLSHAAENLSIFQAMNICHVFMKNAVPSSSSKDWAVFQYAARHGYKELMDITAPLALDQPYEDQIKHMSALLAISCARYHLHWQSMLHQIADNLLTESNNVEGYDRHGTLGKGICPDCRRSFTDTHISPIIVQIHQLQNPSSMRLLLKSGPSLSCKRSQGIAKSSLDALEDLIRDMPLFSTYL